jgi:hypothetical protein
VLFWPAYPRTLALTPQTFTFGLAALTGAVMSAEPSAWEPEEDPVAAPLPCSVVAQVLFWAAVPITLALTPHALMFGLTAFTGIDTRPASEPEPLPVPVPPPVPVLVPLPWAAGAQLLLCPDLPSTFALTPQTLMSGLPALTGVEASAPSLEPELALPPVVLELPCAEAAQLLLWPACPNTLALTPHTFTLGLPAFTGADTRLEPPEFEVDPPPLVLPLVCAVDAQLLLSLLEPATVAFTPQTFTFGSTAFTGAETTAEPPEPEPAPLVLLLP